MILVYSDTRRLRLTLELCCVEFTLYYGIVLGEEF